jgi:Tol biopolymer transport system component
MKIKFSILLICLLFVSCKRDVSVPVTNKAGNANQPCVDTLKIPPFNDTSYHFARFNPNNSNEIIYVQALQSQNLTRLIKKNLSTGAETFIINDIWDMPDWSVKDWIVFNHADNQVWKIKSNGDSLTLLTTNMQGGFYAIWSPDGSKIAYNTAWPVYTSICNENGNALDSLPYHVNYLAQWSKDGMYIGGLANEGDNANIAYQNAFTKVAYKPTNNVANATASNRITCYVSWTPDSQNIIWCSWSGLYKTNITTNQTILLKECCNQRFYTSVSVSSDGQKIIAESIGVASGLCLMDIDGKNEVVIK